MEQDDKLNRRPSLTPEHDLFAGCSKAAQQQIFPGVHLRLCHGHLPCKLLTLHQQCVGLYLAYHELHIST